MIFDRFFTPKHKNKDATIRLQSIENLDVPKTADKQILHELAFNDSHPGVTVAALEKLNSFSLWLKASEISEHKSVKNRAHQRVLAELDNPDSQMLNEHEFFTFCKELKNLSMLESLLLNNVRLQSRDELVLESLARIDKPNTTRLYFKQAANLEQRIAIVNKTDTAAELSKLAKIDVQKAVSDLIEEKLEAIRELEAKPAKIKQAASLITSKLLAAKDIGDYSMLLEKQTSLVKEFEDLKPDFNMLKGDEAYEIAGKFLAVNESLEKRLLDLKQDWEKQQLLAQTTDEIAKVEEQVNEVITQIDALSIEQSENDLIAQSKILKLSLQDASSRLVEIEQLPTTSAHQQWIKKLLASLDKRQKELANLPLISELNQKANLLIEQFNEQLKQIENIEDIEALNKTEEAVKQIKNDFHSELKRASVSLSSSVKSAWDLANSSFSSHLKHLRAEQEKAKKQAVNKLKTVQRLIDQGKFKSAIASFAYAKNQFDELNQAARNQVDKIYQDVSEKVSELQDLQAFIAAPRKPALLDEASALAKAEMEDVKQRVEQVKSLRAQWTSLGQLGTEEDKALNEAFDEQIEIAFAPCREHFAEQEKVRANNKIKAEGLLQKINDLSSTEDTTVLAKSFMALQKQWRELGQVENADYKHLQQQYKQAFLPISKRLDAFYSQNEAAKISLVKKAEALSNSEDLKTASEQAKALQKEWKNIGFAGRKQDDKLWKQFRAANDALFARLNEQHNAYKQANQAQLDVCNEKIERLRQALNQANEVKGLDDLAEQIALLDQDVNQLADKQRSKVFATINKLSDQIKAKKSSLLHASDINELETLFDTLANWTSSELPETHSSLSNKFQSAFTTTYQGEYSRKELTVIAEIIADKSSIKADDKLRKSLQLNLMAARLEGQTLLTLDELLIHWISKGPLEEADSSLLKRLKKLYLTKRTDEETPKAEIE
ncbi:DUF349 domain-containing protein [Glaciecola sp. KUL10]|uniref:DUF349 domain-containing protein n=1 Tax=Glaciecola sp. (strain KUL10) TaxID=2161813 RepID=UPI000D784E17|nr:DUF349 domain-containing protein [Glaciecola sp. KUL10]GBL03309.1 hypothetical protein KUL10_05920 [Glaciecola sp. KUL10]